MRAGLTEKGKQRLHEVAEQYVGDGRDPGRYQVPGLVALAACGDDVHVEAQGSMAVGGAPVAREELALGDPPVGGQPPERHGDDRDA